ncbi:MAG: MBL fold metallo-hydrolase [Betaproteobacteria bacterium]|nr:MBL fold metallo-hydrolase [Betaproteobacteria bacterium]
MRFASLGSGSEGNGLIVHHQGTHLLLDCGFGLADTVRRLARLLLTPADIDVIVVTHEHDDHVGGVPRLARKYDIPVYLTHGTLMATGVSRFEGVVVNIIDSHVALPLGDIELKPFPVPHDAREPTQFVFGDGDKALGVLTDVGIATAHIEATLSEADALVLECNHDREMLMNGNYPYTLKQRIGGRLGHLANDAAAQLLGAVSSRSTSSLQHVIAAHLSKQNNTPALAREALAGALGCDPAWIGVATQDHGFAWREIM